MTLACLLVAVWLLCGAGLRTRFAIFDRIYIPPSVIAGFIGLLVMQTLGRGESFIASTLATAGENLRSWPATLIAVVFAGMLLPRASAPWKQIARAAGREALMVWIIVLGQTAIGLLAMWLIIKPFYDLPVSFGMLLETGFGGGPGTAAAMGQVFASPQVGLPEGLDLGLLMATIGLVYGTVSGIVWINLAIRWGWVSRRQANEQTISREAVDNAALQRDPRRENFARGSDPLLVQVIWLALAFSVGLAMQTLIGYAAQTADQSYDSYRSMDSPITPELMKDKVSFAGALGSFPLFIYTLLGGLIVRKVLKLFGRGHLIDEIGIARWTSMAMDLLVVAAIATLNLTAVVKLAVPFSVLVFGGIVWTAVCLLVLSRPVLQCKHWFELGLINYGMSTGTTATGFVLLRIIDPELKTDAAKDYAIAAPFSAPFIGGGMLTIALPLLVLERVPVAVSATVVTTVVALLIAFATRSSGGNQGA